MNMFDKIKYEKRIETLGQEITNINILIFAINEMIKQSEEWAKSRMRCNTF